MASEDAIRYLKRWSWLFFMPPYFSPAPPPYHPFLGLPSLGEVKARVRVLRLRLSQRIAAGGAVVCFEKPQPKRTLLLRLFSEVTSKLLQTVFPVLKHQAPILKQLFHDVVRVVIKARANSVIVGLPNKIEYIIGYTDGGTTGVGNNTAASLRWLQYSKYVTRHSRVVR